MTDGWVEFVYSIKRGLIQDVQAMAKKKGLKHDTVLRPNGDTILHVCAEYGRSELFDFFYKKFSINLDVQNEAGETPFIISAREGRL